MVKKEKIHSIYRNIKEVIKRHDEYFRYQVGFFAINQSFRQI